MEKFEMTNPRLFLIPFFNLLLILKEHSYRWGNCIIILSGFCRPNEKAKKTTSHYHAYQYQNKDHRHITTNVFV